MALKPEEPGRRTCLRCGKEFDSRSAANRICPKCEPRNARETPVNIKSSMIYVGDKTYKLGGDD